MRAIARTRVIAGSSDRRVERSQGRAPWLDESYDRDETNYTKTGLATQDETRAKTRDEAKDWDEAHSRDDP